MARADSPGVSSSSVIQSRCRFAAKKAGIGLSRVASTHRIEPVASKGDRLMIQNTTFLRRVIGGLLVSLLALVGFQSQAQDLNPFVNATAISTDINEHNPGLDPSEDEDLTPINTLIGNAFGTGGVGTDLCYGVTDQQTADMSEGGGVFALAGTRDCMLPGSATNNGVASPSNTGILRFATGRAGDRTGYPNYESVPNHTVTVTAYSGTGAAQEAVGSLVVSITVNNLDERPTVGDAYAFGADSGNALQSGTARIYLEEDKSKSLFVGNIFSDPDGSGLILRAGTGTPPVVGITQEDADIYVCDKDGREPATAIPDATQPTTPYATPGTYAFTAPSDANCRAADSDKWTDLTTDGNTAGVQDADEASLSGHRVISVTAQGPTLTITADRVTEKGTYVAQLYVRVWDNDAEKQASEFAKFSVVVKSGANNHPTFAGGATGFQASVRESTSQHWSAGFLRTSVLNPVTVTPPATELAAWMAGDLDPGDTAVMLNYRVQDADGNENACWINRFSWTRFGAHTSAGGGTCWRANVVAGNVSLSGLWVDHEGSRIPEDKTIHLRLVASDGFNETSVPISVRIENVNELSANASAQRALDGLRLLNEQESDPYDLNGLFIEPDEGDSLSFSAYSETRDDVVKLSGSTMTLTGKGATEGEDDITNKITVIAEDSSGGVAEVEFDIHVRATNVTPSFEPEGILSVGLSVAENAAVGTLLKTHVQYADEDSPTSVSGSLNTDVFDVVPVGLNDGKVCIIGSRGCARGDNEFALRTKAAINFEETESFDLSMTLSDGWSESMPLRVRVFVEDLNDAPTAAKDADGEAMEIADQSIVVNGSASMAVGGYFHDEDGHRLLITATSSMKSVAEVSVSGLDILMIDGKSKGEAEITLLADDNNGGTVSQKFMVTVTENNMPVADNDAFMMRLPADNTINVGATADIELDGLFTEPDGGDEITSITASTSDETVLLVVTTNDGDTATLVGRQSGMATLTITATDKGGNMTSVEHEITVNAAPEEAMPLDMQSLDRVTPIMVDLDGVFADSDDGADSLMIMAETIGEGMDRATVDVMDGMLTITGVMGIAPGDVEIKLTATDPHGSKATSTVVATIVNVDPTVAMMVEEGQEFDRREPLTVDLSDTFGDADGSISSITASVGEDSVVEVGDIDIADGVLTVTALAVGEATITLMATDNDGGMVESMFTVMVNNVNPVVANALMDQSTTRIDDLSLDVSMTFSDPDDDSALELSVMAADDMITNVSVVDGMLMVEGLNVGTTTVTVTATDADGGMVSHDFTVEVTNVTPTVAMMVDDMSFDRIAPLGIELGSTFADADGMIDSITAMVSDGSVVSAMVDGTTLTLNALAVGGATVTLTALDDNGGNIMTDFDVTVVNIVPVVAESVPDQTTTRVEDLMIDISSTFDDPDQDNSMLTVAVAVEDGVYVEAMLDGNMLTISGLEVGATSVTLTATDADGGMVTDTFTATIENVDPVVANSVPDQSMDRRAPVTLDLSETFSDADDGAPVISIMVAAGNIIGASMIDDSMMVTLTALNVGETTVTLTATDANGATIMDEFNVTVVNIEPVVASAVPDQTTTRVEDVMIDISSTFNDPDFDSSALMLEVMVEDGSIIDATLNGTTLTIKGLDVGNTTVTLSATDTDYGSVSQTFVVTIDNVAPMVAGSISPISLEVGGEAATQAIAGLFSDDGDPLTYSIASADSGIASASISGMTAVVGAVSRGATSFTITAMDPHGGEASLSGSVTVGDGELKAVAAKSLAGFARALLASTSSSVGSRVMTDAKASDLTLDAWAPTDPRQSAMSMTADDRSDEAWNMVNTTNGSPSNAYASAGSQFGDVSMSGVDALRSTFGQSFALNLGSSDNPSSWSVWGDVDRQSYEGAGYDGMASSVYLGADVTVAECWMFGVAVSSNSGESDYSWGTATQTMDLSLTTVLPYVSYQPSNRTSVWGVAGFGSGELDTTVQGAANDVSDLSSQITMVGGSQALTSVGRFDLALRGDAAMASLETDDGAGAADGLAADVNRIRVGLEGSFRTETGQGGMLEPFGQVNLRSDGGDGDTGTGIEIAGGVRMTSDTFTLEVQGRTLAQHGADEYSESGFSLMASLNPSASATGVSVTVAPRWGADAMGNGMFWDETMDMGQSYGAMTGFGNFGSSASVDTQIGYGMFVANERYLLTPFVDVGVSDDDRRQLLVGANLRQLVTGNANLDVKLALGRVEERTGASSGKVGLNATLRF